MLHLIMKDGQPVGWQLLPKTQEERELAGTIRDLQFFGMDDTNIKYNGLTLINPEEGKSCENLESVSWIQKKHQS